MSKSHYMFTYTPYKKSIEPCTQIGRDWGDCGSRVVYETLDKGKEATKSLELTLAVPQQPTTATDAQWRIYCRAKEYLGVVKKIEALNPLKTEYYQISVEGQSLKEPAIFEFQQKQASVVLQKLIQTEKKRLAKELVFLHLAEADQNKYKRAGNLSRIATGFCLGSGLITAVSLTLAFPIFMTALDDLSSLFVTGTGGLGPIFIPALTVFVVAGAILTAGLVARSRYKKTRRLLFEGVKKEHGELPGSKKDVSITA